MAPLDAIITSWACLLFFVTLVTAQNPAPRTVYLVQIIPERKVVLP